MSPKNTLLLTLGLAAAVAAPAASASLELVKKARCVACHAVDRKLVGPSYKDVAARYKGQADAEAKLIDKVRNGGSGNWGQIPMTPNGSDKISDADLKTVVQWILNGAQ